MRSCMAWALLGGLCLTGPIRAETVLLRGGGRVEGQLRQDASKDETVLVLTPGGITVGVPRDDVREILPSSEREQEYWQRREQTPDTIEGHLALAQWCKEQDLTDYREAHLRHILRLDPNHAEARRLLGYVQMQGRWMTVKQQRLAEGLVRYRGRWRLPQEVALLQQREREKEIVGQWYRSVKMWSGWVRDDPGRREAGLAKLRNVSDPAALPALNRFLAGNQTTGVRLLYVDIVARIPGVAAVKALVIRSLADASSDVRWAAIERLVARKAGEAVPMYVRMLHHENNLVVRRAAEALGEFHDSRAIEPLIDALVTVHKVALPENRSVNFGKLEFTPADGIPGNASAVPTDPLLPIRIPSGTVFSPSGGAPKEIPVHVENHEALFALNKLTGQDFHFDKRAWKSWWLNYLDSHDAKVLQGPK